MTQLQHSEWSSHKNFIILSGLKFISLMHIISLYLLECLNFIHLNVFCYMFTNNKIS